MTRSLRSVLVAFAASSLSVSACQKDQPAAPAPVPAPTPAPAAAAARAPADPPTAMFQPLPAVQGVDTAKAELGRRLFHDTALSADNTLSCASCHSLDKGGADGRVSSLGIRGQVGPINSPTVLNARFNFVQFWDGRAANLTEQAAGPVANPKEMGNTWDNVVATLRRDRTYVDAFARSYPTGITAGNVQDAIATYEMTLVTPSRFDRYLGGDRSALTDAERAGLMEFVTTGCTACHTGVNVGGSLYQKMGAARDYFALRGTPLTDADNGRFNVTHNESDRRLFKVPTLRNVALTAPYFHDGAATTLDQAVRTMASVQLGRDLTAEQVTRIVTFLNALTGEIPASARPVAAPAAPAAAARAPAAAH